MEHSEINLNGAAPPMPLPDNYGLMPLKKRLMFLLANRRISFDYDDKLPEIGISGGQAQPGCSADVKMIETISTKERQKGEPVRYCNKQGSQTGGTFLTEYQTVNLEPEMSAEDLEHVPLVVRWRMLLARKTLVLMEAPLEGNYSRISPSSATSHLQTARTGRELTFVDQRHSVDNRNLESHGDSESESSKSFVNPSSKTVCRSFCAEDSLGFERNDRTCSSKINHYKGESNRKRSCLSAETKTVSYEVAPEWSNIKIEQPNYGELQNSNQLALAPITNIKVEPSNYCDLQLTSGNLVVQVSSVIPPLQKTEVEIYGECQEDKLDHMLLRERMKLLSSEDGLCFSVPESSKCTDHIFESAFDYKRVDSTPAPLLKINRSRKRRKTVTDSIETAMEEDAPGLLKVLIDKGVSVNEIKLYGEPESNDALDDTQTEDGFSELEEVIAKLFSRKESFIKLGPLGCTKVEKASYCLECLFSLIEQARYLQFRNWPVEWGWCRYLQSFIFVFERHNRIVLERPEYGFATYFF